MSSRLKNCDKKDSNESKWSYGPIDMVVAVEKSTMEKCNSKGKHALSIVGFLKAFLNEITSRYFEVTNDYHKQYSEMQTKRRTAKLVEPA